MKLRANEYCACIGFSGKKAVVSKQAARQYKAYDLARFLREGLFRQAFSLAYFHGDQAQMQQVLHELQGKMEVGLLPGRSVPQNVADLVGLFGSIPAQQYLSGILYV